MSTPCRPPSTTAASSRYEVTVAVTARDTDAIVYRTVVEYDQKRRDDPAAMKEALKVAPFTLD